MKNSIYSLVFIFLVSCSSPEKRPTDRQMYGFKAPVKKLTTYSYKNLTKIGRNWYPADTADFYNCVVQYYDNEGNIDSIIVRYKSSENTNEFITNTIIYEYKNGVKTAGLYRNNTLFEKHTFTWKDEFSCLQKVTDTSGKLLFTIATQLNKSYREEAGEWIAYGDDNKIKMYTQSRFLIGKKGWWARCEEKDVLTGETKWYKYTQVKYDHRGTPVHTEEWENDELIPTRVN